MRKLIVSVPILLVLLLWFPAVAYAQGTTDAEWISLLRPVYDALVGGNWAFAGAALLVVVSALMSRFGTRWHVWFGGGAGRAVIVLLGSLGAALVAGFESGASVTWSTTWAALKLALMAAGGYSLIKVLVIEPLTPWMEMKAPGWLFAIFRTVAWIYDRLVPSAQFSPLMSGGSPRRRRRASTAPLTVALLLVLVMSSSCATVRRAGAAGAAVGLDCQAASVQATVLEAGSLARAYVLSTISGSGSVDTTALRAAARDLRSDALRCAFAAALAGLAEAASSPPDPESPQSLGLQLDPAQLRAAVREIAESEWGIEGGVLVGGELL